MPLFADVVVHRGDFTLDASVSVADGETLALLGPNGSGKSTLLAAIAGLLVPESGHVEVNGRVLTSTGARRGQGVTRASNDATAGVATGAPDGAAAGTVAGRVTAIEPHARRVGLLGQDPLLFPHLSALENVAFGARARGESAVTAREAAFVWLKDVGLSGFSERRPTQLSGGQQQRVAIARALAAEPQVLLLDEPMAALDVQNASAVRTLLRESLGATALPTIVVSHDVIDAMVLADRVAIMDEGRIVDVGDPAIVLGQPANQFAANLAGLNIMRGKLRGDGVIHGDDGRLLAAAGAVQNAEPAAPQSPLAAGETVIAAFPPSAVRVCTEAPSDGGDFAWRATVGFLEPALRGIRIPFLGETFVAELAAAELLASGVREGMPVTVSVDPALVTVYRHRGAVPAMAE